MIPFNIPPYIPECTQALAKAVASRKICGDGPITKEVSHILETMTGSPKVLLTTSCTAALELSALLLDIQAGDEVIMPSYTFVSTANAFALRGATIVFVDVTPSTMNIDPLCVEKAITSKTKAIVAVHYAGICCDMEALSAIAKAHHIALVEDAAQAVTSLYKGKSAGALSDIGCFSFHETKNFSMGEGGAVVINRPEWIERAEIIREKGTDRSRFFRGQVDKYTWMDIGSSFLPSELNVAYLLPQLQAHKAITAKRMEVWQTYHEGFEKLEKAGKIQRMYVPEDCVHNAHMYYIKTADQPERSALIAHLAKADIMAVFHYVPLHSSQAGRQHGRFEGEDVYTTIESDRLLRLPFYYDLEVEQAKQIIEQVYAYYS